MAASDPNETPSSSRRSTSPGCSSTRCASVQSSEHGAAADRCRVDQVAAHPSVAEYPLNIPLRGKLAGLAPRSEVNLQRRIGGHGMRLAALYLLIWAGAASAWSLVELGWQPPLVAVWDGRAHIYFDYLSIFVMFIAAVGLVSLVPLQKLPIWLRVVPGMVALGVTGFFSLGILELSNHSTLNDVMTNVLVSISAGAGFGIVIGLIAALDKGNTTPPAITNTQRTHVVILLSIAAAVLVSAILAQFPRPIDDGTYTSYAELHDQDRTLGVGIVKSALVGEQFGVIKIENKDKSNSLTMEHEQWDSLIQIWNAAKPTTSNTFVFVGKTNDTYPSDHASISVSAERGVVRFYISSPNGIPASFEVRQSDYSRLDSAMGKVKALLSD
jgi:Na+-translocating ferredoxin:NAD+ oxidoreductase RnfA subunit